MFNIGGGEMLVIALIALIVLGPSRLPGAARQAGKVMADLRRVSTGFQNEVRTAFQDAETDKEAPTTAAIEAVSTQASAAAPAKKAPAKKAPAKKAAAKKAPAKKAAAKKVPAKKAAAKKAPAKKTAAKKSVPKQAPRRSTGR